MEEVKEIPTSIFPDDSIEHINKDPNMMSTWLLLGSLVVIFFVLKTFIYIPDEKRKNK